MVGLVLLLENRPDQTSRMVGLVLLLENRPDHTSRMVGLVLLLENRPVQTFMPCGRLRQISVCIRAKWYSLRRMANKW